MKVCSKSEELFWLALAPGEVFSWSSEFAGKSQKVREGDIKMRYGNGYIFLMSSMRSIDICRLNVNAPVTAYPNAAIMLEGCEE